MKRTKIFALVSVMTATVMLAACGNADVSDTTVSAPTELVESTAAAGAAGTAKPETAATPEATSKPTATPDSTEKPETTEKPAATAKPETTAKPAATAKPETTEKPETTAKPGSTAKPAETSRPAESQAAASNKPVSDGSAETPVPTKTPEQPAGSEPAQTQTPTQAPATQTPTQQPAEQPSGHVHNIILWVLDEYFDNCTARSRVVDICSDCGYIQKTYSDTGIIEMHDNGTPIIAYEGDCQRGFEQYWICATCGRESEHLIDSPDPNAHKWVETSFTVTQAGDCCQPTFGVATYTCSVCGATKTEDTHHEGDPSRHNNPRPDGICGGCGQPWGKPESEPTPEPAPAESEPAPVESESESEPAPEQPTETE